MRSVLLALFILFSGQLKAAQCTAVFADGAGSHSGSGQINFKQGATIFGSDGLLDFANITDDSGGASCFTQSCTVSGNPSAEFSLGAFQLSGSSDNIIIARNGSGNITAGEYADISAERNSSINFTTAGGLYLIKRLQLNRNVSATFAPGDYWIEDLTFEQGAGLTVSGSGTVRIYTKSATFNLNSSINNPGDPAALLLYSTTNIDLEQGVGISGYLYAENRIKLDQNAQITGGVSASNVTLERDSFITFDDSAGQADMGDACEAPNAQVIDHFRIDHDGLGLTCEAETVTIRACMDSSCTSVYDQNSSVEITPFGVVANLVQNSINTQVALTQTTAATVNLGIANSSVTVNNGLRCYIGGALDNSCAIAYSNAGFDIFGSTIGVSIEDQIAGRTFSDVNVRAVKDDEGVCVALLQGSQDITLTRSCVDPGVCKTPLQYGATDINNSASVNVVFDENGIASLSELVYFDAGRINLAANAVIDGATITSGNEDIVVYPARLSIAADDTNDSKAGENFTFNVRALALDGTTVLPNYSPGELQFYLRRRAPLYNSAVEAYLELDDIGSSIISDTSRVWYSLDIGAFTNGISQNIEAYITDVGRYQLDVRDINYFDPFGARGPVTSIQPNGNTQPITLGSFIPAYFDIGHNDPSLTNVCSVTDGFSYLGQPVQFDKKPEFTLTARNAIGNTTQNYQLDYWHWLTGGGADDDIANAKATEIDNISLSELNPNYQATNQDVVKYLTWRGQVFDVVDESNNIEIGKMRIALNSPTLDIPQIIHTKPANELLVPFAADTSMVLPAALLSDDSIAGEPVCYQSSYIKGASGACETFTLANIDGADFRWGRIVLANTYGPENQDLVISVSTEYVNSSGSFERNRDDHCTSFNWINEDFALSDIENDDYADITGQIGDISSNFTMIEGETLSFEGIFIPKPINGGRGQFNLELLPKNDLSITWDDYLQFDWNSDPNIYGNPSAIVSFGQFRGNDRIIHWREVFK